jgi:hypothetical protein
MRWTAALSGAVSAFVATAAVHAAPPDRWPLPPQRPPDLSSAPEAPPAPAKTDTPAPTPPAPSSASPASASSPSPTASCLAELAAAHVEAEAAERPPAPLPDCGIASPVRLKAITLASGAVLDLPARPLLDCPFAATFAAFLRDVAAPLAAGSLGSTIVALDTGPGYECRGRDHVPGAKTSAHGQGAAIDVMGFVLADKRRIAIAHQTDDREALFVRTVRTAACGWFTTILGPGSDPAHATHMHLDTIRHGSSDNYRICE